MLTDPPGIGPLRSVAEVGGAHETQLTEAQLPLLHTHNIGSSDLSKVDYTGSHNSGDIRTVLSWTHRELQHRQAIPITNGSGLGPTDDDNHGKGGFASVAYVKPLAGPEPDIFGLLPNSMANEPHTNMPPFLVLDYIIKI